MGQAPDVVLVREPGNRTYNPPVPVVEMAKAQWEYTVLSENVYIDDWTQGRASAGRPRAEAGGVPAPTPENYARVCTPDSTDPLPLPGWVRWDDFPRPELSERFRGRE